MVTIAAPNHLHAQMTLDCAQAGQARSLRKAPRDDPRGSRRDDRRLPPRGRPADVRRGTVLHSEIRQGQGNGRPGRVRQGLPGQAEREALRPAQRVVLGRRSVPAAACSWTWAATASRSVTGSSTGRRSNRSTARWDLTFTATRPAARTSRSASSSSPTARLGLVENSWARRGGMDDRVEVYGEGGVTYANLHMGNALPTYSEYGYGYAVEKAPTTKGWSYPVFEELWNYGFPQEMRHFARCVRGKEDTDRHRPGRPRGDGGAVRRLRVGGPRAERSPCRSAHAESAGPSNSGIIQRHDRSAPARRHSESASLPTRGSGSPKHPGTPSVARCGGAPAVRVESGRHRYGRLTQRGSSAPLCASRCRDPRVVSRNCRIAALPAAAMRRSQSS